MYCQCIASDEPLWSCRLLRVLCYSYPHMRGSEVRSLLSPDHHEPLCSCSPPCLSVFLGGITPCKFPSGRLGQLPTIGWFWAIKIHTLRIREITWRCTQDRGFGQASHCPLCRAFADPG